MTVSDYMFARKQKKEEEKCVPLRAVTILMRMKMGHTAVSDIESSSVTLKTWRKEPEKYCNFEHIIYQTVDAKTTVDYHTKHAA